MFDADDERLEGVRRRLTDEVRQAIRDAAAKGKVPARLQAALGEAGSEKLAAGAALESFAGAAPAAALEAIVQRFGRPPLLVRNDEVDMEPLPDLPGASALIAGVQKWIPSVGRIEFVNHRLAYGGTGWVADHAGVGTVVVTNRHVAKAVALRKADGTAVFARNASGVPYRAEIDFREEVDASIGAASRTARLTKVLYLAEDIAADVALLLIEADGFALPTPMVLDDRPVETDELVALIGYPAYDPRNDESDMARYFRDLYEVKRFAPGKVLQPLSAQAGSALMHDCTSLGGNSGSPLLRLDGGGVVGLHFSGLYGVENQAVGAATLKSLLAGRRPQVRGGVPAQPVEAPDAHHPASWFLGRRGFDMRFLGEDGQKVETPWPRLPAGLQDALAQPDDGPAEPNELRYTHFGVKYSRTHKLPLLTAVNIDGGQTRLIKRDADQWFTDGRIPREIQLASRNFGDPEIDRGHMVRREDPNWGPDAQQANDDTFHYVNAAPQHAALNRGKALWQGLENYVLTSARTHGLRVCVFTGPLLRPADSPDEELVIDDAIVPLEFWKVIAALDAEGRTLRATAYLLSQGHLIRQLMDRRRRLEGLEGFEFGPYRTFQIAVGDLAEATGYDFGPYVAADPLAAGAEEAADREPAVVELIELSDVRL